jgi:small conductance mechanosensitive channel
MSFLDTLDDTAWLDLAGRLLSVGLIILLALGVLALVGRIRRRMVGRVSSLPSLDPTRQRTLTVAALISSTARYVVWGIAAIMILDQLGLDIAPVLAGAGVAGLAVGFGAQTLVKDVIAGVFLLFDDTLHVGDQITHGAHSGEVEYIGLRLVKIRTFDGELVMIPAGELRTFGNRSVGYARAVVDVPVRAGLSAEAVLDAVGAAAAEWAERPENGDAMLDAPEVQGLVSAGDQLLARVAVRVRPGTGGRTERDLRRIIARRLGGPVPEIPADANSGGSPTANSDGPIATGQ